MSARILIVEDNPTNIELMVYLLTAFGYTPTTALSGEQGLIAARATLPHLVLLDVQLPGLSGVEVAGEIQRDFTLSDTRVVAVTARAMVGDRDKLLSSGFDGYIAKPLDPERFVGELEAFLPPALRSPLFGLREAQIAAARRQTNG